MGKKEWAGWECDECGEEFSSSEIAFELEENALCADCLKEASFVCWECNGSFHIDKEVEKGGESLCEGCADYYFVCENCEELVHENDVHGENDGNAFCESCFSENEENKGGEGKFVDSWFDLNLSKIIKQKKVIKSLLKKAI